MKRAITLLAATSAFALSAAVAGEINGRVIGGAETVPLRGAQVTVQETGQKVTTGRDGSFRVTGLDAGSYTLLVTYLGSADSTVSVSLGSDSDTASVNVSLGDAEGDILVVTGQRGSFNAALNQKRNADTNIEVLSADAIGRLPDENVAEAARRAIGLSVANDQGEGRFVSIRGINSNLNATSVNGVRIPSPEAEDRQVALDVIDSDILKNIIISKSLTPDMDADVIGGNIELETLSGLDVDEMFAKVRVGTVYSELADEFGELVSGAYANNYMDGKFGVAGSVSYQSRDFGSENKEVDGGWETAADERFPDEYELRNYDINRERLSAALNLDYQVTEEARVYVRSLYNDFSDQEYRSRVENKFEDGDFAEMRGDVAVIDATADDEYEVDRDIKDRLESQEIYSIQTGLEVIEGPWTKDFSVSYAHSEEEEPNRLDTAFRAKFDAGEFGINVADTMNPLLAFPDASAQAEYFDTDNYELDAIELTNGLSVDEEVALEANFKRDMMWGENPGFLKFGAKYRARDKSYDLDLDVYEPVNDITLTGFGETVDYPLDQIGVTPEPGAIRDFFFSNFADTSVLERADDDTLIESTVADYSAKEDILATYIMGQMQTGPMLLTGGLRIERTEFEARGFVVDEDAETVAQLDTADEYTDLFPSLNMKLDVSDVMVARVGYYRSAIRPNFAAVAPRALTNEDFEVEAGNPDLDRQTANNLDLAVEYYPNGSTLIQAGVFYKKIDDFIAPVFFEGEDNGAGLPVFNGLPYTELSTFQNLENARIFGFELGYQQALDNLPAPFDGLIVGANYTYVDSETTFGGRSISLPGQSENVANAILGYDKGRLDLRAAVSYRDEFIDEIDLDGADRVALDHVQLDLTAKVDITDDIKFFADFKNVNDEAFEAARRYSEGDFLSQYEEYGYSIRAGFIWKN